MAETASNLDFATPAELAGATYEEALRRQARKLKEELIRQTLEDAASWKRSVEDKWANAHPGEWAGLPISEQEVAEYRQRVRAEDYEWIIPSFERYLRPDPDQFNPIIESLAQVEAMFGGRSVASGEWAGASGGLTKINTVRVEMAEWQGDFRDRFIDSFVDPLQTTFPNHGDLARVAGEQMKLTKIVYLRQRKSVLELLDNAIKATQALSNGATSPEVAAKWGSIVLVVVGTLGGPFASTLGVAAGFALLEVAGTITQGALPNPPEEEKISLGAPTATEVAVKVSHAMSMLNNDVARMEQVSASGLGELNRLVERQLYKATATNGIGPFSAPVPALASATPAQIMSRLQPPGSEG
jgi:hypothetical protein